MCLVERVQDPGYGNLVRDVSVVSQITVRGKTYLKRYGELQRVEARLR